SRSPQSRGASQSRSSPVSTNSPGALIWAPAGPAAGSASGTARLTTRFNRNERKRTMPIKVGDRLPQARFRVMTPDGPAWKTTDDIFKGKKVALFAVPGAFTGPCHKMHVPSIMQNADAIKAKGVSTIAVISVNSVLVMGAWKSGAPATTV